MSEQNQTKELMADLTDPVQELTTSNTLQTADRDWMDNTLDIQEMLRTSSPPSGTTVRTYRGPRSHTMDKTVSETPLLWITILYINAVTASIQILLPAFNN